MPRLSLLALGALTLVPLVLHAQDVRPGSRIRVRGPCGIGEHCVPVTGSYVAWNGTTLTLRDGQGAQRQHEIRPASTVEVARGSRGHALAGLAFGAGLGLIVGVIAADDCANELELSPVAGLCGGTYVVGGVGVGALTGLLVGALMKSERWDRLSAPTTAMSERSFVVVPVRGGVGVGMGVRF